MDSNAATVEGAGHNVRGNDCMLNCLPEMKSVYYEHFKPFQDKLSSVLQHSRSHITALAGRESFAGFLNVPLISDVLVKTIEVMFEAPKPCVLQLQNDEASANINWLDVVKEKDYQADYKGNGNYHFHMRDRGVIVQLSAFQHNMILSGLPRKLVQPWSYEKDVQTELSTLALAAEMTSLVSHLASEVIKVNNTALEEILRRDRILRRNPEPSQRSAGSPFPLESAEEPAQVTPAQADTGSPNGMAIEAQGTNTQASGSKHGAGTRNFPKNRAWPAEVLKRLPLWFEHQVRENLSQEEIAQNFQREFKQKRTFHAIEAKVYLLTGKSPFRKRNKRTSGKEPVSLTLRSSPPLSQPLESVDFTQPLISRSNIEVHALRLAPSMLPYLPSEGCEDGSLYALHSVHPVGLESESSDPHALSEQEIASRTVGRRYASQEQELPTGTSQNICPVRESPQAEGSPTAHPAFSDLVPESQPRNEDSINVLATTLGPVVDPSLPQNSPIESSRISEPIQSPIQNHREGETTLEELGQTHIHRAESSAMHVEQADMALHNPPSGRISPQSSPREPSLARGSAKEGSNELSHPESGLGALTVPRAVTLVQFPEPSSIEPSSTDRSIEHHSRDCEADRPTTDTSENLLSEQELISRYLHEKSEAQSERSHRPWIAKDLDRLPGWLMKRKNLRKERLEVEFLRDFGQYRTSCAIVTACRKKRKADSRQKDVMPVSRSPNAVIETPSSEPSKTIAVPSNDNTTPKHPLLERPRSSQLQPPQVSDNAERLYRNNPPLLHEDTEAVDQNSPAASECTSEQMALSTSENAEDTPTLGSRRHRVGVTPEPLARFTAINGDKLHPTGPNISDMTPLLQIEANEREAFSDGQGSQRASKEKSIEQRRVEQRRDDQHMSQERPHSRRGRPNQPSSEYTPVGSHYARLAPRTPEGAHNQQSFSTRIPDANVVQQELPSNLQNTAQPQVRDPNIQPTHIVQPRNTLLPKILSNTIGSNSQPSYLYTREPESGIVQDSNELGSAHTGVGPISVSSSFQSSPTSLPHYPLHELQGGSAERYQGPPLPSLTQQMYHRRAGEPFHR